MKVVYKGTQFIIEKVSACYIFVFFITANSAKCQNVWEQMLLL